ncbi:MAG: esterase [Planctomycetaceae bacterium]|nr:esterase [Planctomycetaceae bacterium]
MNGTWSEQTVGGHPCDLYEPTQKNEHGFAVIYLHGVHLNRLVDKTVFTELFERHGLPVVAPMTQRSWWTDRVCPEFDAEVTAEQHLLCNVVPFVCERFGSREHGIALFGTSMGGQGALRISYKHPGLFPVVAAIAPAIDFQIRFDEDETLQQMYSDSEAVRQDTATLHIHPLNWPRHQFFSCDPSDYKWWGSANRLRMKLWSLGVPHECDLETTGGGHGFEYYNTMAERAVGFIAERLDQERRRLV